MTARELSMKTSRERYRAKTLLVLIALAPAALTTAASAAQLLPDAATRTVQSVTKNLDPCAFGSEAQLRSLLGGALAGYFPLKHSKDGEHITISHPRLTDLKCPNLRVTLGADIRYQKTQGVPQFSSSGKVRFISPLVARVTHSLTNPPVVHRALACLTNINVTELNLNNVPNWVDNTWVRQWLNGELANRMCFDVTSLVSLYVQQGGRL
jgi:hypothetical protein